MKLRTLLLVDEKNVASALNRLLRRDGYHILCAENGSEALELLNDYEVGVIISDQRMQGMTGIDFLARAKASYRDSIRIVLSGFNDPDTITDAINKGHIFKFIAKPWDDEQLRATVRDAFEYYELRQENRRLTEELQAANAFLTQSNQETSGLLEEIVNHNKDGIVVVDQSRKVLFSNPSAIRLLQPKYSVMPGDLFLLPIQENTLLNSITVHNKGQNRILNINASAIIRDGMPAFLINLYDVTEQSQLEKMRVRAEQTVKHTLLQMVNVISLTIEKHDPQIHAHQLRVAELVAAIAQKMSLPEDVQEGVHIGALVHNLGELYVPAEILKHPGVLDAQQRSILQQHPKTGFDILSVVDFPWPVAQMVLQHHEYLDGSGYPCGLSGDDIIMEARIIAVADTVLAMLSNRPYRKALAKSAVIAEIGRQKGLKFDPAVVDACLDVLTEQNFKPG